VEFDLPPDAASPNGSTSGPRLLPGMSGTMHLRLRQFGSGFLVPTTAVYSRSGKPYILEVRDGKTLQTPVRVQLNDGTLAKVAILKQVRGREVLQELTGTEEIVASRQLEVGEGQAVKATRTQW
jgi:hypothetical protein